VLTFPWNFPEVIEEYEADYKPMSSSAYWSIFMNNTRSIVDLNNLYRDFHQGCAIPCQHTLNRVCEGRLASHVGDNLKTIHFHGLDVEMANLTVEQPSFRVLKAEVTENLSVDRSANLPLSEYNVGSGNLGPRYVKKNGDDRSVLDLLNANDHRPYLVALTCLVESPMKLYV
jgi:hypothetical protein